MNSMHITAEQLDAFRHRATPSAELLAIDRHIASCDTCFAVVSADVSDLVCAAARDDPHLGYEDLERFVDGRADEVDRELVEGHAALCRACRNEVTDLMRVRDAMAAPVVHFGRAVGRRRLGAAAAAAVVVIAIPATWLWPFGRSHSAPATTSAASAVEAGINAAEVRSPVRSAPEPIVLRIPAIIGTLVQSRATGGRPNLRQPVRTVVLSDRPQFLWMPEPEASTYDVTVADAENGTLAAAGSSATPSWCPDKPLPRGRTYTWQVTAHDADHSAIDDGPAAQARFHVAEAGRAAALSSLDDHPLERGIALAVHGVLDDAERELQLAVESGEARASAVLAQVRTWRQ